MPAKKQKTWGKYRFDRTYSFPTEHDVVYQAKKEALEPPVSSPALTAWYVSEFCSKNRLKAA